MGAGENECVGQHSLGPRSTMHAWKCLPTCCPQRVLDEMALGVTAADSATARSAALLLEVCVVCARVRSGRLRVPLEGLADAMMAAFVEAHFSHAQDKCEGRPDRALLPLARMRPSFRLDRALAIWALVPSSTPTPNHRQQVVPAVRAALLAAVPDPRSLALAQVRVTSGWLAGWC
jgi:hypothetical protein